ncbi:MULTISPECIES: sodium/proline symporter PutP [unclassified Microbacterium]|uniref:sodium/proline symporter PutP n=1 Tax=unclassified Microbacterium TaxID=2609290 RepID=UPI0012F7DBFB|nr:sodium/proline symporter PutP [Microbacterium sp. MAH-37]MVQ41518.1 sodium/proline symporter PutP [Microbacterium sp. MAH-37]
MSDSIFTYVALGVYFAGMLLIGWFAFKRTDDHEDYMLGGRNLPPWVAAISAGAADMSGWLVMGLPGVIYLNGLIEAWIAIGLTIGAYLNWLLVAPRLRAYTEVSRNSITVPSFFENRLRDRTRMLRILSGVVILVFFTLYISSGMVAAGKFFEGSFNGDYLWGMLLVGGITLLYTLFGGFLGASLTDVVQGLMMVVALIVVPVAAVIAIGGIDETATLIDSERDPGFLSLMGTETVTGGTVLAIVSALAWGLGYFGQPHIVVRFMALRSPQEAKSARRIGISWMVVSMVGAVISGIVGVAYMASKGITLDDPETVVLVMSRTLLHPFVAGLVLAAVLAAIMSTVSSQLVVCSSALVEDLYKVFKKTAPEQKRLVLMGRMAVLVVAIIAILLAITPNDTVLGLVSFAWAGFGAAFGPIILLSLFWRRLTNWGALAGMFVGAATVFIWKPLNTGLYELLPGFVLAFIAAIVVSLFTYKHNEEIQDEFTQTGTMLAVPRPHAVGDTP